LGERTVKWLRNRIVISEPSNTHGLFVKAKANPEVPTLSSYSSNAPESFWEKFPKSELPSKVQTKINTEVLDEKIEKAKGKMLPHQFARAKKALSFLRYGAPAYQKLSLPGCKVSYTPSTVEYGVDVADTIASWVKKGFASGPFSEPPLDRFRMNCLMGSKVRPILNISIPETVRSTIMSMSLSWKKLKCVPRSPSVMQFWRPEKEQKCTKLT
jgi:hypothetical protein